MRFTLALLAAACFAQQSVTVTSDGVSTSATVTPGTTSTIVVPTPTAIVTASVTSKPTTIVMPIEVVGPANTSSSAQFVLPTVPAGALTLWLQIHNLDYDTEASVQVNNSVWLPISTAAVAIQGSCANFGGIGGGCNTLSLTMLLPAATVVAGVNTIAFRFNGTDGIRSGFRVLGFNIQSAGTAAAAGGAATTASVNLIPASTFVQQNPASWTPPLNDAADIAAGLSLWQSAALSDPASGATVAIKAHCSDCHEVAGRDLKYFNFSNASIEARAEFHGLSAQQGAQIASYIRSLTTPAPGQPWNPPYQPGPGIDALPVSSWSAGAGISAVLANDAAMLPYLAPGGSYTGWAATAYLNPRQTPIVMQLPDWSRWLPQVHPMDAYPAFMTNAAYTGYTALRGTLAPATATAYKNSLQGFQTWGSATVTFQGTVTPTTWTQVGRQDLYSLAQWRMTKMWELNQDFGLEAMASVPFGAKANSRGWYQAMAFNTAPNILHLPAGAGLGNGSTIMPTYLSLAWYELQLVQNDGQGQQSGHEPMDFGYVGGFIRDLFDLDAMQPGIMLQLEYCIKGLQEFTLTGTGPQAPGNLGWNATTVNPSILVNYQWGPLWSATTASQMGALLQAYTQAWFTQAQMYTPSQYYAGGWAVATDNPVNDNWELTFAGQMWYMLPRLRYFGVSATLTAEVAAWAATIWPAGNWALMNTATCSGSLSTSKCSSD